MIEKVDKKMGGCDTSSEDEFKGAHSCIVGGSSGNHTNSTPKLKPTHLQDSLEDDEPPIIIEYRNKPLVLGSTWKEVASSIDLKILDKKLAISLKVCLLKKLRVTPE